MSKSSHDPMCCVPTKRRKALLSFMLGATDTTTGPEVAPVGMVTVIDVPLQEVAAIAEPFNITAPVPCEAPKPEPEITAWLPATPAAGEIRSEEHTSEL